MVKPYTPAAILYHIFYHEEFESIFFPRYFLYLVKHKKNLPFPSVSQLLNGPLPFLFFRRTAESSALMQLPLCENGYLSRFSLPL